MNDYYDEKLMRSSNNYKSVGFCFVGVVVLVLFALLSSCTTTKYVPVETVRTEYITKHDSVLLKDSVFLHDSVYIHAKGDTVWYEKWHVQYQDRIKEVVKTDTVIKNDSIQVPYPVERKLSTWEQIKMDYGGKAMIALAIVLYIVIWLIVSKLRR